MKKSPLVVTVSLTLIVGLALAPTAAVAGRGHGGFGRGGMVRGGGPSGFQHHGFNHGFKGHPGFNHGFKGHSGFNRGFNGHPGFNHGFKGHPGFNHGFKGHHGFRPFFPWGVVSVWTPPLYYGYGYGAPAYYPPPAYYASDYAPPPVYGSPGGGSVSVAPAPPTPSVVQFPNGRYELRGDGISTPYTWVWIPNPPQAPPAAPPAPPGEQPTSGNGSPARHTQFYRWTDEQGVVHLTNQPDAVPAKYRTQAKQTPPS
jgi:Domain of unknown function (DUF4124)